MQGAGVRMETRVTAVEITSQGVRGKREDGEELFPADTVVVVGDMKSDRRIAQELKGKVEAVRVVGDCVEPRRVAEAIWEGFNAGLEA